jgi:ribonuclease HI
MNFDGTSKGNPGQAGYGGVFLTNKGNILRIYGGQIGINTNNAVKSRHWKKGSA